MVKRALTVNPAGAKAEARRSGFVNERIIQIENHLKATANEAGAAAIPARAAKAAVNTEAAAVARMTITATKESLSKLRRELPLTISTGSKS